MSCDGNRPSPADSGKNISLTSVIFKINFFLEKYRECFLKNSNNLKKGLNIDGGLIWFLHKCLHITLGFNPSSGAQPHLFGTFSPMA